MTYAVDARHVDALPSPETSGEQGFAIAPTRVDGDVAVSGEQPGAAGGPDGRAIAVLEAPTTLTATAGDEVFCATGPHHPAAGPRQPLPNHPEEPRRVGSAGGGARRAVDRQTASPLTPGQTVRCSPTAQTGGPCEQSASGGGGKFTIAAVIVTVVGTLVYQFWFRRVPEGCAPVIEPLDFNQRQSKLIGDKYGGDEAGIPSPAELRRLHRLGRRAGRPGGPGDRPEPGHARGRGRDGGQRLRRKASEISATPHAPAPTPPAVYQLSILNDQITADIGELTKGP